MCISHQTADESEALAVAAITTLPTVHAHSW